MKSFHEFDLPNRVGTVCAGVRKSLRHEGERRRWIQLVFHIFAVELRDKVNENVAIAGV